MSAEIPLEEFDVILIGTGLTESIISGSLARKLKVLHLDEQNIYGAHYGLLDISNTPFVLKSYYKPQQTQCQIEGHNFKDSVYLKPRNYNIEIIPKMIFSRGEIVELLRSSGACSYVEFHLVEKLYFYLNNELTSVPGGKEDVFVSKEMTLIEKRKLMKFLTFVLSYEAQPDIWKGLFKLMIDLENRPLKELLSLKFGLEGKIIQVIITGLIFEFSPVEKLDTLNGLMRLRAHLDSVGRYGKSAFLNAMYGTTSELCQGFCR